MINSKFASAGTAITVLSICCIFWGFSFPAMQYATVSFERHLPPGPGGDWPLVLKLAVSATIIGLRFLFAGLLYAVFTWNRQRRFKTEDLKGGAVIGLFFASAMYAQIIGLRYTKPSVSAFLTALAVVFAPLAQSIFFREAINPRTWLAVGLALGGVVLLSFPTGTGSSNGLFALPPVPLLGEMLTILCSMLFTGYIIAIDRFGKRLDASRITFGIFFSTAAFSFLVGLPLGGSIIYNSQVFTGLATDWTFLWSLLSMVIFSSVLGMHLMNVFQPMISPAVASVVYCLEPLFGTFFSVLLGNEVLSGPVIYGGLIILSAVLLVSDSLASRWRTLRAKLF